MKNAKNFVISNENIGRISSNFAIPNLEGGKRLEKVCLQYLKSLLSNE
jgi:hypothetical protein